ncbi:MAG: flippase-like domain-containing protein [Ardenticatenaceae bacterium]|nr:flippase-like domain-containing protein [Ardenticatenaceae bacterium]
MKETAQRRQFWIGMGISLLCLIAIFFFISPRDIWQALQTADYGFLALSALCVFIFMVIRAVRWRFMLNNDVPWGQVFHIQNIGYMLTNILPLRLGDVARAVLIGNVPPVTIARGFSTMVVERVLDLLFIVTLLPFTLAAVDTLPGWMQTAARAFGISAIGAIVVLIIAANQRPFVRRLTVTFFTLMEKYRQRIVDHRSGLFKWLPTINPEAWGSRAESFLAGLDSLTRFKDGSILSLLSILTWLPILIAYYVSLRAVHLQPTPIMSAFVVCAAAFSVALPSSPGQIGVFHAGVIAALQILGQPEAESASFAFLYHAFNMVGVPVVLGIIGIYSTGATFNHVVASTRAFMKK